MDIWSIFNETASRTKSMVEKVIPQIQQIPAISLISTPSSQTDHEVVSVDISNCILPTSIEEVKRLRKLSHLSSMCYKMHQITPYNLRRLHNLQLVVSSFDLPALPSSVFTPPPVSPLSNFSSSLPTPTLQPSHWFAVDDPNSRTRLFVIQGSDSWDHWRLNFTVDPVLFEDLRRVKVHSGAYQAALVLLRQIEPYVRQHVEGRDDESPARDGGKGIYKVAFTGHSIGGSLAILIALMLRRRGLCPDRIQA
eukprot:CAMPEP_0175045066 /NCGR_PEP_ID=MMETSP0052_2-20121109/4186_1 /TAXON_ID=51329 ORGANISM="Polytomella parva, Strain SAG 63-3" /NCGR_SAMPLE_ID=MMETSP0052_2 /ASSEMBLY_ACC=CAM_ASM_000194 /LENGTH=250 /DNA_ID=CAMNT_0016308495 /DNA_START=404 /DNA_END=1152 /DNA_ORIENTATION=+